MIPYDPTPISPAKLFQLEKPDVNETDIVDEEVVIEKKLY